MAKLSDTIARTVETPSCETQEGFPLVAGFDAQPSYYPDLHAVGMDSLETTSGDTLVDSSGTPVAIRIRENRRIRGCNYFVGGVRSDCATVEGGLHDATRQALYQFYRRLHALLWIAMGYQQTVPYSGQYNGDWDGANSFGMTWEFVASQVSSTVVRIRFTPGTAPDPRNLSDPLDSKPATAIMPGDCVYSFTTDGATKTVLDQAMIRDIEWLGVGDGGYHYANLTLTRPVFVARNPDSKVLVGFEKLPAPYRDVRLDGADRCRYAKQTGHTCLSSFAAMYPTAAKAEAISGEWHCAKWRTTEFSFACSNTACPDYVKNSPTFHADDLSFVLAARGVYVRHTLKPSDVPSGVTDLNYRWGRENWSGFLELIGFPVGWYVAALDQKTKEFAGAGVVLWRTGTKTAGFDDFIQWYQKTTTDDHYGLLDGWTQYATPDPGGALASDMRLTSRPFDRQAYLRGPAWQCRYGQEAENAYACGHAAAHAGNLAYIGQSGNSQLQTLKPRRYTSKPFRVGTDQSVLDESTHVTSYAATQTELSGGGVPLYSYKIAWQVPAFAEQVWSRRDVQQKTWPGGMDAAGNKVSPKISSISYPSANILKIEFATAYDTALKPVDGSDDETTYYKTGGLVVCPDNAKQSRNPISCSVFGDRNIGLCAGDLVEVDGLPDVWLPCVDAQAFGGSTDTGAGAIDADATDIPDWLRTNHAKRDVAYFDVSGPSGTRFRQWAAENLDAPGLVGLEITRITRNGISPARYKSDGTETGFFPVKVKRWDATNGLKPLAASEYKYDCTTGTFYISPASGWATDQDTYLFTEQYVYDRNTGYSCEMVHALDRWMRGLCRGWLKTSIAAGTSAVGMLYYTPDYYFSSLMMCVYTPPHSGVPFSWTLPDCPRNAFGPGEQPFSSWFGDLYNPPAPIPVPYIPSFFTTGATGADNSGYCIYYREYNQLLLISLAGTPMSRCTSSQVWRVLVNVTLSGGRGWRTDAREQWVGTPGGPDEDYIWVRGTGQVEVDTVPDVTFSLAYSDNAGAGWTKVGGLGFTLGAGLTRVGEDMCGTIDATAAVKYILDHDAAGRLWGLYPASLGDAANMVTAHEGHRPTEENYRDMFTAMAGWALSYDAAFLGDAWVQLDPDHLDDAPVDFLLGTNYLQERPPALA